MADGGGSTEDQWVLAPAERELVMTKNRANRLGFAILLTFFRDRGRFPRDETEVEVQGIAALAKQLDAPAPLDGEAFLTGRTAERLRGEIRVRFGFREATVADAEMLTEWLRGTSGLGVLMLSPLVLGVPGERHRRWIQRLNDMDLSAAINPRLSRLAGRPVALQIQADSLYLRANPRHSVLVSVKQAPSGQSSFVIGLSAPLVLVGSEADLRLAWYAGLGEKTRAGFGCIGLLEHGVGR